MRTADRVVRRHSSPVRRRRAAATELRPELVPEAACATPQQNRLLLALDPSDSARLAPHLRTVRVATQQVLIAPGEPIHEVYFPSTCVASTLAPAGKGFVHTSMAGSDGIVGLPLLLGASSTNALVISLMGGDAMRCEAPAFKRWLADSVDARLLFMRYVEAVIEQTAQSVVCERLHTPDQRCAHWLLATADRIGSEDLRVTHDFIARVLGTRRATVTVAAQRLERMGLIAGRRGHVRIVDRERLTAVSCECYRAARKSYDRLIGPR